jgi:hypothetical protein
VLQATIEPQAPFTAVDWPEPFLIGDLPSHFLLVLSEYGPLTPCRPAYSLAQSFDAITLKPAAKKAKTGVENLNNFPTSICNCVIPYNFEVAVCDDELSDTFEVTSASHYFKL